MDEQFIINDQPELFQVEGQLAEEDVLFIEETSGLSGVRYAAGEIITPLRAKSKFSIGEPKVYPFAGLLTQNGQPVPADIYLQLQHYEFYQVQLACSFWAAEGCRFHVACFGLDLQTAPADSNAPTQTVSGNAIAYDLFPLTIEDERRISIKHNINPEITFGFDSASSSLKLPYGYERSEEYVTYKSRIVAFGLQGPQPEWHFTRTASHEIEGSQKLFMILRKPKGTHVKARFNLTANVQFTIAGLGLDLWPLVMVFRHRSNPNQPLTDAPQMPLDLLV
jgi:hypothetical protein